MPESVLIRTGNRLVEWWWLDAPVAAGGVLIVAKFTRRGTGADLLGKLALDDRRAIYTDLVQYATIFGAFVGLAFTVYIGFNSKSVVAVRQKVGGRLLGLWLVALIVPWLAAGAVIVVKAVDRGGKASPTHARLFAYMAVALLLMQLARVIYVFFQLVMVEQSEEWTRPTSSKPLRVAR